MAIPEGVVLKVVRNVIYGGASEVELIKRNDAGA
jgi:hypothetical protein